MLPITLPLTLALTPNGMVLNKKERKGIVSKKLVSKRMVQAACLAAACLALGACGKKTKEPADISEVTLHIFNTKGEIASQFEAMCEDFTAETGIKTEPFTVGSGEDSLEPLRAQMTSSEPPAIFNTDFRGLPEWEESRVASDLNQVKNADLKKIVEAIPENMRLTSEDGTKSYGIPYGVEGFGFIVDSQMLADLFGEDGVPVLAELRTCSYEDFIAFCDAVTEYIAAPSGAAVSLNGKEFTFLPEKTGMAANLNGVFAVAGSENWTYGNHLLCVPTATLASNLQDTVALTDDEIKAAKPAYEAFMKALEYMTSHAAGLKGATGRGQELVNSANFGYDQSIQMLTDGNALFLQQGNWASANIAKINEEVSKRVSFIPLKQPITDDMMKSGITAADLNASIPFSTGSYWLINDKISDVEKDAAETFLAWMMKPENVQKYIVESFVAIPYNADESIEISDSLASSIQSYIKEGKVYYNCVEATPSIWASDYVAAPLMERYLTKETWTDEDISSFMDSILQAWIDQRSGI